MIIILLLNVFHIIILRTVQFHSDRASGFIICIPNSVGSVGLTN